VVLIGWTQGWAYGNHSSSRRRPRSTGPSRSLRCVLRGERKLSVEETVVQYAKVAIKAGMRRNGLDSEAIVIYWVA
jgi:hypothetical protein